MDLDHIPSIILDKVDDPMPGIEKLDRLVRDYEGAKKDAMDLESYRTFDKVMFEHLENNSRMHFQVFPDMIITTQWLAGNSAIYHVKPDFDIVLLALSDFAANVMYEPLEHDMIRR